MSNATDKVAIANISLLSIGEKRITSLTENTPHANKISSIIENVIKELLADDWYFNRKRVLLTDLTQIYKLTVDTAPTPAAFSIGATLTGASSSVTCTVIEKLSDTVYLVTEPSGDWTDGEVIGDGTNTVDCATDYPESDDDLEYGAWDYGYKLPDDYLFLRGVGDIEYDKLKYPHKREGQIILTNHTDDAYLHYNKWIGYQGSSTTSDVTLMPNWFHRLISARLAHIMAPNVTENMRYRQKAEIEWDRAYLFAKEQNGFEADLSKHEGHNDWADGAHRELGIA